jgi:hypothetical protein
MSKPRILVVEDEADIRRFVRMALEMEGMSIAEAKSAEEARIDSACRRRGQAVPLTEFRLLATLVRGQGKVLTRRQPQGAESRPAGSLLRLSSGGQPSARQGWTLVWGGLTEADEARKQPGCGNAPHWG